MVWSAKKKFPIIIEKIRETTNSDITDTKTLIREIKMEINIYSQKAIIQAMKNMEEFGFIKRKEDGTVELHERGTLSKFKGQDG